MVKKIVTSFAVAKKTAKSGEAVYRSPRIYLPTKLTDDSVFPFKEGTNRRSAFRIHSKLHPINRAAKHQRKGPDIRRPRRSQPDDRREQEEPTTPSDGNPSRLQYSNG